ncbi:T9SS type A sorting domain-containing protein [Aureispira anguillae]|uniref:T9SS type A sorting domain-containing protein n=1 Tax=Aureispira anguillae TaxID=2864201 RepID=A0A915YCU5_9BACT|nr:T9SS type A sorting domain-containing protein [Aureispira anguillae]BDS10696.1 T9SS type A sorting domain-containing protein [Aureispira anguillae]
MVNRKIIVLFITVLLIPFLGNTQHWNQKGVDIDGEAAGDNSGSSVSLSSDGNTLAIGAYLNAGNGTDAGHVRVHEWNGTAWNQKGVDIDGEAANDWSGSSVSLSSDGNTLAIGAYLNDGNGSNAGHVRVYEWNGITWTPKGVDIDGEAANDRSGSSVSLNSDGNTLAIGARGNDGNGTDAGHVRVYEWNGTAWIPKGVDIDGEAAGDFSGSSLSLSSNGNTLAIGAERNDGNGSNAGHVHVYEWNGTTWTPKGVDIDGEAAYDNSGSSVSLSSDGNTLVIGAYLNDGNGTDAGHVRVYEWNGTTWNQKGVDIDGEAANDWSGSSVSLSSDGNILAIGALWNDGNGTDAGHVCAYEFCSSTSSTDVHTTCDSYTWIDGNTYTSSNNTATFVLTNMAGCDSIVTLDLTINTPTTGTDVQTACDSYTWIDGNTYTSSNNTATFTLQNVAGCDSIVTLDLTINLVNTTTSIMGVTIMANTSNVAYQWLDCNNNNTPITGETGQSFTATTNGNYAVIVTENGCSDTSACVAITTLNINKLRETSVYAYPNPTQGDLMLSFPQVTTDVLIKVSDTKGQIITTHHYDMAKDVELKLEGTQGIYLITITHSNNNQILRCIKQ